MSNSLCKARLISPILGLASMIQDTVKRIPGITSGMMVKAKNNDLNGVFVRSFIHARAVPRKSASPAAPAAKRTEFKNSDAVSALK